MKQQSFIPYSPRFDIEHGGDLAVTRRRSRRPVNPKKPVHIVLRSNLAVGRRSLLKNQETVKRVLIKFSKHFGVRIYERAICGNHIHCLVKADSRRSLQNFFRVFAGQVAQEILRDFPLQKHEKKAFRGGTHPKNHKSFWSRLLYSRIVRWGRDFRGVRNYVIDNTLEALGLKPYRPRKTRYVDKRKKNKSTA
jgi:REP element-mobilizing transposase RayT